MTDQFHLKRVNIRHLNI